MIQPQILQRYFLFTGLVEEQIIDILPLMQREEFAPDAFVITEGKTNDKIYFILEGRVAVSKKDIVLTKFGEGEAFGEMEMLDMLPAAASIKTLSNVSLMSISNQVIREIYKKDINTFSLIIMNLARNLSRRIRKMDETIANSPVPILNKDEAVPKLQFCGQQPYKTAFSQPANPRFDGEKRQELAQNLSSFGTSSD